MKTSRNYVLLTTALSCVFAAASATAATLPAHGVSAANVKVVQNDTGNTAASVTVTAPTSVNGFLIRSNSNRGDFLVQVGVVATDDPTNGVLMTSVNENGRDNGEGTGTNFCTSAISLDNGYFIPTSRSTNGAEYNINVGAAYFPYSKFRGGYARNSAGTPGATNNLLTASPGLVLGTHFVDNGGGTSTVNLVSFGINSQTNGILLVTGGGNDNNYAMVQAITNGTWKIYTRPNGSNQPFTLRGPVAFAYVPKTNAAVISGKFSGSGSILMYSGASPRFSVTNTTTGTWQLSIPGHTPTNGVLVISAEGGGAYNMDNIVSSQPSGTNWLIQSRDVPGLGLQTPTGLEPVVSFAYIPTPNEYAWSGGGTNGNWSTVDNWDGAAPVSGNELVFSGATRLVNTNNLSGLSVPSLAFNSGGFSLYGNAFTNTGSVSNRAGINTLKAPMTWNSTAAKTWHIASGTELVLDNTTTVADVGDHSVVGGGTLRQIGTVNFTSTPAFAVNEGKHIINGGTFNTLGGYRVGSLATGTGAQTILTNGATLTITAAGGNLRVGDSANPVASRLDLYNSTLSLLTGVRLTVPYAAGATGIVNQTGGTVTSGILSFSEAGAGSGSYTIKNGTLVARQIRENTPSGSASIYFDNAIVRTDPAAVSDFMTGLNLAQIQAGGLTLDATVLDITIGQAMSGSGALTKTGGNRVTLTGANTFTGNTTISAGTLAVGTGGAIASPNITLANGTTLDVSAVSFTFGASQTLVRNASSGVGNVTGNLSLASGAKISLQADGSGTVGTVAVTGNLTANGNTLSINVNGTALGVGTYPLITYTGTKTGSFNATPTITGAGVAPGYVVAIQETAGQISLSVLPTARVWDGGGTDNNWSTAANWDGVAPVAGDKLIFSGATRLANVNNLSGLSVPSVSFTSGGFSLSGNGLTVTGGVTNSTGNNAITAGLTLGGAVRLQSDAGTLTVGSVSGGANNLTVDGAGNTTANGVLSGTGSVTKNGAGTLTLSGSGANTYSGGTVLNAGILALAKTAGVNAVAGNVIVGDGTGGAGADVVRLDAANQIPDTATVTVSASGNFNLNNASETVASLASGGSAAQIALGSGTLTVGNGSAATFAGSISGTGNLVKQGASTLTLSGANTFSGTLTVNAGVVNPQHNGAFGGAGATVVNIGAAVELQGGFTFSESLTLSGTGIALGGALRNVSDDNFWNGSVTLVMGSSINSDSGTLTIGGGVGGGQNLTVAGLGSTTVSGPITSGSLTKNDDGMLTLNGANTYTGNTIINAGTLALGAGGSIANSPGITLASGVLFDVSAAGFTLGASQTLICNVSSGVADVAGNWTFAAGAQASFQADGAAGTAGSVNISGDVTANGNTLSINVNGASLGAGTYPLITYTGTKTGSFNATPVITGAGIAAGNLMEIQETPGQINLRVYPPVGARTWSGGGADNNWSTAANWGGLVPTAGDMLTFTGAMRLANVNNLSGLSVPSVAFASGGFSLSGNGLTVTDSITNSVGNNAINLGLTLGGALQIQSDAGTLTLGGAIVGDTNNLTVDGAGNTTINGVISGGSTVTKKGAGTLTLSGASANPHAGDVLVNAGLLVLAKPAGVNAVFGNIVVGDIEGEDVTNTAELRLSAAHQIPDFAQVIVAGNGTFTLNNANETVGAIFGNLNSRIDLGSGTLTVANDDVANFGGIISGSGQLVKQGAGILTLYGTNTFTGDTTVSAGTLAIEADVMLASSNITFATGTTLDILSAGFTLGAGQTLVRNAASGDVAVIGNLTLASGAKISLQGNNGFGTLSVAGDLTLNGNTITINFTGGSLGVGTYPLITYTGTKTGSFQAKPTIIGLGIGLGLEGTIEESAGVIALKVSVMPQVVAAANIKVVQNDTGNTTNSVAVTTTTSINGLQIREGSNRGDFHVQVGASVADDMANGVMLVSVAQNGRDNGEGTGTNYCTSFAAGGYFIGTTSATNGAEYNIDVSAAYFPYSKFFGGYARNATATPGGPNNLLTASPGLVLGTHFVDNGGGTSTVNLVSFGINSQTDGVLLVTGGENNNDYASAKANTDGTWTVFVKDNAADAAITTQGPLTFAFVPKAVTSVISGKFQGTGAILLHSDVTPRFSVTNTGVGTWQLSIPGHTPSKGVLVISAEGGYGYNRDNIVSAQPSGNNWIIQSRDLPGRGLQSPTNEAVVSFVFVPRSNENIWSGDDTNSTWSTAGNWTGGTPVAGDKLIFSGTTRQINTNNLTGLAVPSLTFNNGGFAIYGNGLTVTNGVTNSTGNNAFNAALTWGGAARIQSDAGTLTLGGAMTNGANSLTVDGAGNTTVGGVISGTSSVTKNGAGTLTLSGSGANTFSGGTILNAGTLALGKTAGVNAIVGNITVGDGLGGAGADVLRLDGANQIPDTATVTVSASGLFQLNSASETVASVSSASDQAQMDLVSGTLTMGNASAATFAGTIVGAGSLVKQGTGTLTLSGANSFDGTLTISAGVVNPQHDGAFGGVGATVVNSGAAVELQGGFTFSESLTLNGTGIASGGALRNVNGDNLWNGSVTLVTGSSINSDSGTLTIVGDVGGGQNLTVGGNGSTTVSGPITSGSLTKNGSGTLTLDGANTYTGGTVINTGTLKLGVDGVISSSSSITLANGATLDVSAASFILGSGQTLVRNASSGVGTVTGNLILDYGAQVSLQANGSGTVGTMAVTGDLTANGNTISINVSGSPLGVGTYPLITYTGAKTGSFEPAPTITGVGLVAGCVGEVQESAGQINLNVSVMTGGGGRVWSGGGADNNWSTALNWDGSAPVTGDKLTFSGTTRLANVNNLSALSVPSVSFLSSGFSLSGNGLTVMNSVTNSTGNNDINLGLTLGGAVRLQSDAGVLTVSGAIAGGANSLTVEGVGNTTVSGVISGSGSLTKKGTGTLTLSGANTYTGGTTISAGTLALGAGGSIASSPTITIMTNATLNVSAVSFTLGASQTLARSAATGVGTVTGNLTMASGAKISLQGNGTIGTLNIAGNLTLNANVITINFTGGALAAGTYPLVTYTGTKTGSFNTTPTIVGSGLGMGLATKIVETTGVISLKVYAPAHGVAAASIKVVENDLGNTTNSVTVTTTFSVNGLQVRDGSSRGDYLVQVGASAADDLANGVLISSVARNGQDNGEDSGINYCTSSSLGTYIATANAPDGDEYNIDVSAAYFPYAKFLGGYARNSAGTDGGPNNLLTSSPGLVLGTHFVDNGGGTSTVNLASFGINSQTSGILLVNGGENNNKYASAKANTDGTWKIYVRENSANASNSPVRGAVAFAFVPKTNTSVISGKFNAAGSILMYNGASPRFSVTNTTNGIWQLSIPGYSPSKGVLVISAEGGGPWNVDNIVSAQPSGNNWLIQSRDLPGASLQTPTGDPVASFVFIPGPTATLVSPANNATNIASSPTLKVTPNHNGQGNLTVTYYGRELPRPGPGPDFLIPVIPDTQRYAAEHCPSGSKGCPGNPKKEMWFSQMDWIKNNRVAKNIPYVATLGDCVNDSHIQSQWRNGTNAYYRLEDQADTGLLDGIPYGVTVGNHDSYPEGDHKGPNPYYNQYFGISHFSGRSYYGGHWGSDNDNWYNLFSVSGLDFLVISIEWDGAYHGTSLFNWARGLMAAHPTRRVIVLTHSAGNDVSQSSNHNTTECPWDTKGHGKIIYDNLRTNGNFFLMMAGHVYNDGGEGRRSDTYNGKVVNTLVSDYQGRINGGNGLMRLMTFSPANNKIYVKTYSPYTGAYETDNSSQFEISYNMQPNGAGTPGTAYAVKGTNVNVVPGAQAPGIVWSGLTANRPYEWYVTVTDENGDYATSVEWTFKTTTGYSGLVAVPADADGDGIPDSWEAAYGLSDANADADGDGQNNYAEYISKTNPTNAASALRIIDTTSDVNGQVTLTWTSVGGVRYRIQSADSAGGTFTDVVRDAASETDPRPSGATATQSYTEPTAPTNTVRFYRVKVVP